jgi:hypothetical protein
LEGGRIKRGKKGRKKGRKKEVRIHGRKGGGRWSERR